MTRVTQIESRHRHGLCNAYARRRLIIPVGNRSYTRRYGPGNGSIVGRSVDQRREGLGLASAEGSIARSYQERTGEAERPGSASAWKQRNHGATCFASVVKAGCGYKDCLGGVDCWRGNIISIFDRPQRWRNRPAERIGPWEASAEPDALSSRQARRWW